MGATSEQGSDGQPNELPIRRVKLDSYYIGECEITQGQWSKVMGTSIQQQTRIAIDAAGAWDFVISMGLGSDYPMYLVSWEEAQAFCEELSRITGKRYCLPTEAQWEYAARGGKKSNGTKYSGSWSLDAVGWYDGNSGVRLHPVKNKRANELGLYDMSGNVCEWCSDWYGPYNINNVNNPTGATSGRSRVLRGGRIDRAVSCRVSARDCNVPEGRELLGFRVVLLP